MAQFNEEVTIDLQGDFTSQNPTIGSPSLVVGHSENGRAPGVIFENEGGGFFIQSFQFGADSNLPNNEAGTIIADWHGLTFTAQSGMLLSIGPFSNVAEVTTGQFTFANANVVALKGVGVGTDLTVGGDAKISGTLAAGVINSPTISALQNVIDALQNKLNSVDVTGIPNLQSQINNLQSQITQLFQIVSALSAGA
jgi:hypothetical protein